MEYDTKENLKKWVHLILILAAFFLLGSFNNFAELINGAWWIFSFNILILAIYAVKDVRFDIKSVSDKEKRKIVNEIEKNIEEEQRIDTINNLNEKWKKYEDRYDLYAKIRGAIKFNCGKSILISSLLSVLYLILFFVGKDLIGIVIKGITPMNIILLIVFFVSLAFLLDLIIDLVYFFERKDL
ncbi:MAG: hypothetical protein V1886_02590 [archaeon]